MYDFIGDIHGHADRLAALLKKLGYSRKAKVYRHPERKAFFVGDLIDRGPEIKETVHIVRSMVEGGTALAVMGNHELNAIQFHTKNPQTGNPLRAHIEKNINQHKETLASYGCVGLEKNRALADDLIWFKTLPFFFESDHFRVVHATWDEALIKKLKKKFPEGIVDDDFIRSASVKKTPENNIVEVILKGREIKLPDNLAMPDKEGHVRSEIRVKWWDKESIRNFAELLFPPVDMQDSKSRLAEHPVTDADLKSVLFYKKDQAPVFFGHYWKKGEAKIEARNICCLDYSVAMNGKLAAYRFDGEESLDVNKFLVV